MDLCTGTSNAQQMELGGFLRAKQTKPSILKLLECLVGMHNWGIWFGGKGSWIRAKKYVSSCVLMPKSLAILNSLDIEGKEVLYTGI